MVSIILLSHKEVPINAILIITVFYRLKLKLISLFRTLSAYEYAVFTTYFTNCPRFSLACVLWVLSFFFLRNWVRKLVSGKCLLAFDNAIIKNCYAIVINANNNQFRTSTPKPLCGYTFFKTSFFFTKTDSRYVITVSLLYSVDDLST